MPSTTNHFWELEPALASPRNSWSQSSQLQIGIAIQIKIVSPSSSTLLPSSCYWLRLKTAPLSLCLLSSLVLTTCACVHDTELRAIWVFKSLNLMSNININIYQLDRGSIRSSLRHCLWLPRLTSTPCPSFHCSPEILRLFYSLGFCTPNDNSRLGELSIGFLFELKSPWDWLGLWGYWELLGWAWQ